MQNNRLPIEERSSEKVFGLFFGCLFIIIGLYPLIEGTIPITWALFLGVFLISLAIIRPSILKGPNYLWFKFGQLLGRLIAPIIMFFVYFLAFMPLGIVLRIFNKDTLEKRCDPAIETYWKTREMQPQPMERQF